MYPGKGRLLLAQTISPVITYKTIFPVADTIHNWPNNQLFRSPCIFIPGCYKIHTITEEPISMQAFSGALHAYHA